MSTKLRDEADRSKLPEMVGAVILDGRYAVTSPKLRNEPDFPLRGYARCETCGKPLTASWSKGRSDYYAYYHCRGRCRSVNISKAKLEELFVEELARLEPSAGFMRLVKDRVMRAWREVKTDAAQRIAEIERRQKAIREKLDRLDQAFLFEQVFFPDGIRFDGKRLVGTGVTLPVFNYLSPVSGSKKDLVDQTGIEPVTS